jgi:hypothetical protein
LKIPFVSVSFPLAKRGVRKSENAVFHKEKIRFLARFSYAFLECCLFLFFFKSYSICYFRPCQFGIIYYIYFF